MEQARMYEVLLGPHVSEKSTNAADKNRQVVFKVVKSATKPEIKKAVESIFKVEVTDVTTSNKKGKVKRFRQYLGQRKSWKKAFVTLKEGQDIDFTSVQ